MNENSHSLPKPINLDEYELQRAILHAIIDASPDGILVVDENAKIISHNQRFVEVWRIPSDRLCGTESGTAIGTDDSPILAYNLSQVKDERAFLERVKMLYGNPQLKDHCEIELKDGRTLERHSTVLYSNENVYLGRVWFFRDISLQKQMEFNLRDLAHHDPLTGISNRRYFSERANQEFARTKRRTTPLSLVILDVDYFKQINDRYGHAAGDEMLKLLCGHVQGLLRETDIFARLGGEEFAVLLPDTGLEGAAVLAERLRQSIAGKLLALGSCELGCTVSIGVAMLKSTDACIDDCVARADCAMYRAKQNGRNRVEVED